jgi:GT2 family glycosyltransferase
MLSVIIPIYAATPSDVDLLRGALQSLNASTFRDFEILIADDASPHPEPIRALAIAEGALLVRQPVQRGPAAARNAAAARASGEILVFFDADTSVHADTLHRFARAFNDDPGLDALVGSYDQQPTAPGRVSRFRNLLHSFVHHRANGRATTFWTGCGAVRKHRFVSAEGFSETFTRASIEDVEFGLRLHQSGARLELDPRIQVTHHKAWTLRSMVWTDLYLRAIPWVGLMRKHPLPRDLNFRMSDRVSGALVALLMPALLFAFWRGGVWWLAPLLSLAAIALLNAPLFRFLARAGGWPEALLSYPLLLTYFATCVAGLIAGRAKEYTTNASSE